MRTWQDWENVHQPYELRYHTQEGIAWCKNDAQFQEFWSRIFDFIGVSGRCLDVGCGPRPPFGRGSTAIEPLGGEYALVVPEWWEDVEAFFVPAERLITELVGNFDTVLCWNCLDHTIGWKQILLNLASYGADNAMYAIATDFDLPHEGHPGFHRADFYAELRTHFRIVKHAENFQERAVALVLERCKESHG